LLQYNNKIKASIPILLFLKLTGKLIKETRIEKTQQKQFTLGWISFYFQFFATTARSHTYCCDLKGGNSRLLSLFALTVVVVVVVDSRQLLSSRP